MKRPFPNDDEVNKESIDSYQSHKFVCPKVLLERIDKYGYGQLSSLSKCNTLSNTHLLKNKIDSNKENETHCESETESCNAELGFFSFENETPKKVLKCRQPKLISVEEISCFRANEILKPDLYRLTSDPLLQTVTQDHPKVIVERIGKYGYYCISQKADIKKTDYPFKKEKKCLKIETSSLSSLKNRESNRKSFKSHEYRILQLLGKGSYGQVFKCQNTSTNEIVAVKALTCSYEKGLKEIEILQKINLENPDEFNCIRLLESFFCQNQHCLVFDMCHQNLHDFQKENKFEPMPLHYIRPILYQVLVALEKLKSMSIIHADLKPQNIMFVNPIKNPFWVKVIDFSCAINASKAVQSSTLQTRHYRSPEILLGLPFDEAIDMWSLGCIIAELFIGCPLYPGSCEYDQIRYICNSQDFPPERMLKRGTKTKKFFKEQRFGNSSIWNLKTPKEFAVATSVKSKERQFGYLDSLVNAVAEAAFLPTRLQ